MKRYIWLVSYLVKDENGDVAGYKTAFEALITSVGLADDESAELIGEVVVDTLAIDWPE